MAHQLLLTLTVYNSRTKRHRIMEKKGTTLKKIKVLRKTLKGLSAAYKYVTPGGARNNPFIEVL